MLGISEMSIIALMAFEIPWLYPKKLSLLGHKSLNFNFQSNTSGAFGNQVRKSIWRIHKITLIRINS